MDVPSFFTPLYWEQSASETADGRMGTNAAITNSVKRVTKRVPHHWSLKPTVCGYIIKHRWTTPTPSMTTFAGCKRALA